MDAADELKRVDMDILAAIQREWQAELANQAWKGDAQQDAVEEGRSGGSARRKLLLGVASTWLCRIVGP